MSLLISIDINEYATSKNDLDEVDKITLNLRQDDKEINSDIEEEFDEIKKKREETFMSKRRRSAEQKGLDLDDYIEKKFYRYHRISMKNDATLYYDVLFNSLLSRKIFELWLSTDEYIIMSNILSDKPDFM